MSDVPRAGKDGARGGSSPDGFTAEERAAMKERAAELKAAARRERSADKAAADLKDVLEAIAAMPDPDRKLAERLHATITNAAPGLAPRTWYGMPAYARNGKAVVFFQGAEKFKARYATLGFNDDARLDEGTMWPTAYALTEKLDEADWAAIEALVRKAAG